MNNQNQTKTELNSTINLALSKASAKPVMEPFQNSLLNQTLIDTNNNLQNVRYNNIDNQDSLYNIMNKINNLNLTLKTLKTNNKPQMTANGQLIFY